MLEYQSDVIVRSILEPLKNGVQFLVSTLDVSRNVHHSTMYSLIKTSAIENGWTEDTTQKMKND